MNACLDCILAHQTRHVIILLAATLAGVHAATINMEPNAKVATQFRGAF